VIAITYKTTFNNARHEVHSRWWFNSSEQEREREGGGEQLQCIVIAFTNCIQHRKTSLVAKVWTSNSAEREQLQSFVIAITRWRSQMRTPCVLSFLLLLKTYWIRKPEVPPLWWPPLMGFEKETRWEDTRSMQLRSSHRRHPWRLSWEFNLKLQRERERERGQITTCHDS
jgi:hypothetical protein